MNENQNIQNSQRQDSVPNIALFAGDLITPLVIFGIAQQLGYAHIKIGKQTSPFEQLKEPAAAIGLSLLRYCQENIEPKDIVQAIARIAHKL